MKNLGKNVLYTLAGMLIAGYAFFFVLSVIQFPTGEVLGVFYWRWVLLHSLAKLFEYALPLSGSAVLIAVSFLFSPPAKSGYDAVPFSSLITSTIIVLLAVLCAYTLTKELSIPRIHRDLNRMKYETGIAENARKMAKELFNQNLLQEADETALLYLAIDPDNIEMETIREEIRKKKQTITGADEDQKTKNQEDHSPSHNLSVSMYIEKAEYYYKIRDYYSAHYFANQALTIDPDRVDVKNLSAMAWKKIEEFELNAATREEAEFFSRKRSGYTALQEQRYIDAYYIFHSLKMDRPAGDPDIQRYFKEAEAHVQGTAFFIDEAEETRIQPGVMDILFINRRSETERTQFVYFKRYVMSRAGYYGYDVEVLELAEDNSVAFKLYAPYGKIIDSARGAMLVLQGISRTDENERTTPRYENTPESSGLPGFIVPLYIEKNAISLLSIHDEFIQQASIPVLLFLRNDYAKFGFSPFIIQMELLNRLRDPFMFLILVFLAMSLGWVSRVPADARKLYMFGILPIIPFLFSLLTQTYKAAGSVVYMYFLLQTGFLFTLGLVILFSTFMLFLSLLVLALKTSHL
ncbi:MAG: hypothetical protein JXB03_12570 [Spirochaetales bacterium]|nr:hypothetical protein [Spirochaetales bacterium]